MPHGPNPLTKPMLTCGFCEFGPNHDRCPGGVRNGNGKIVVCACTSGPLCGQPRCTDCGNRTVSEVGPGWQCIDRSDCEAEIERKARNNPTVMRIRAIMADYSRKPAEALPSDSDTPEVYQAHQTSRSRSRVARQPGKPCLCGCEQITGGGKFRPGHDSRYLTQLVTSGGDESRGLAYEISEAFGAKYDKRMVAA